MKKFSVKTIVAIGIGAALFFVLGRFVAIPSPVPNTNISSQYGLLAFMAAIFGPLAGLLIGLIGHALIDFSWGGSFGGIWWSWVIASAVCGLIMGIGTRKLNLSSGRFSGKDILRFNVTQIIAHIICWGGIAPALDVLIYHEPTEKLVAQGLMAGVANIVTTAVIGTLLCLAYAKSRPQKGSLEEEKDA